MSKIVKSAIVLLVSAAVGYGIGRYIQPAEVKIKTETKIKTVEIEVEKNKKEVRTIVREIVKPDGTTKKETITENISENKKSNTSKDKKISKEKKVTKNLKPQWKVQVQADLSNSSFDSYRVGVERRVFGPIHAGAWSDVNFGAYGVSVSMEF